MTFENVCTSLKEFAKTNPKVRGDKEFNQWANNINNFVDLHKKNINVNNSREYCALLQQEGIFEHKNTLDESLGFLQLFMHIDLEKKGFVDFEEIYQSFTSIRNNFLNIQNNFSDKQKELLQELEQNITLNESIDLQKHSKPSKNSNIDSVNTEIESSMESTRKQTAQEQEQTKEQTTMQNTQSNDIEIEPLSLINYIKDEEQIKFPFSREKTLDNPLFLANFYGELNQYKPDEIQALIDKVKAKNQKLREQLEAQKSNEIKELEAELIKNAELAQEIESQKTLQTNPQDLPKKPQQNSSYSPSDLEQRAGKTTRKDNQKSELFLELQKATQEAQSWQEQRHNRRDESNDSVLQDSKEFNQIKKKQ